MQQLPLPGMQEKQSLITNVASVPQRSPFRYPGGKTWLVPQIRAWLSHLKERPAYLIEPFAGGSIVGLTAAFENLVDHVTLVELDDQVAAVWKTILNPDYGYWLANAIATFDLTAENVNSLLAESNLPIHQQALQTIIKNRVNRGGILASGAGQIKHGENRRGLQSRWYPETLKNRILDIIAIKHKLTFVQGDGFISIRQYQHQENAVFFVDPPYTASTKKPGNRLYDHSVIDHKFLFNLLSTVSGDFLLTYDDDEFVRNLAHQHAFTTEAIPMKSTHHMKHTELMIGRDFSWIAPRSY